MILKNPSIRRSFYYITVLLCVPLIVMIFILFSYTIHLQRTYQDESVKNALREIASDIDMEISDIKQSMLSVYQSMDFLSYCNSRSEPETAKHGEKILHSYRNSFFSIQEVSAAYLYHTQLNTIQSIYRSFNDFLPESALISLVDQDVFTNSSQIQFREIDGNLYGITATKQRFGILLLVFLPEKNLRLSSYNTIFNDICSFEVLDNPDQANTKTYQINDYSLWLACSAIRYPRLNLVQIILLLIIIALLIMIFLQFRSLEMLLIKPITSILSGMETISSGNLEYRLQPSQSTIKDIRSLAEGMNHMLDEIQRVREEGFRLRMDAVQAKLQYLQLQIRPHFFLNCLKNMNALLSLKQTESAQTLLYALSNYISFAFSDIKNFIPLQEELQSVQNYVDLCNMLSYNIKLSFHLPVICSRAVCLPMTVLTFVENSIKHTNNVDHLYLSVNCSLSDEDTDEPEMTIIIKDSGGGFPEEYLKEQSHTDPSEMVYRRTQIGISNVRYRLWLVYGENAQLKFYNEGTDTAVVELTFPFDEVAE